jgi:hypothetical protein
MAFLTGVAETTPAIQTAYTELKAQLPVNNDIRTFSGSNQVAITKLAVEYCDVLFNTAALRASFTPGVNFAAAPATALNPAGRTALVNAISDNILGIYSGNESKQELAQLLESILQGKNLNTVALTANVAKGLCAAALSSAAVMLL